jgi:hypothetical protein
MSLDFGDRRSRHEDRNRVSEIAEPEIRGTEREAGGGAESDAQLPLYVAHAWPRRGDVRGRQTKAPRRSRGFLEPTRGLEAEPLRYE